MLGFATVFALGVVGAWLAAYLVLGVSAKVYFLLDDGERAGER